MTAAVQNFNVEQGASFACILTFKNAANEPIDINGWKFRGSVKKSAKLSDPVLADFVFTPETPSSLGRCKVTLSDSVMTALPVSGASYKNTTSFVYDMYAEDGQGFDRRIVNGLFVVSPSGTANT